MTDAGRREAARQFYQKWVNKGREDEDDRSYWIDFLQDVMGVDHVTDRIVFQKKVLNDKGSLSNRIDAYIPETRVLIEQKSLGIDLSKPQPQHDNKTPYEQAKEYDNALPVSEKAKWIILSNFAEIWVYDMDTSKPEPQKFALSEIQTKYSVFEFLINQKQQKISHEMEISVKAGEFVGLIYEALLKQYKDATNKDSLRSLNMLCVRLVFCLYAEDAHIFDETNTHMFHDYMAQFETKDMRRALIDLFKVLDTPEDKRDPYDTSDLSKFPYVNGGLFEEENIEIPNFTDEIRDILLAKASEGFDWSMISPTIFGAVFESTLNPETRRSGGMHYTSIENIHKVIDPLFLDELKEELNGILALQVANTKKSKLEAFQNKLSALTWYDPACGSGNFLTETYISVRKLENQVIRALLDLRKQQVAGQMVFVGDGSFENPIKVQISQFYGMEINDFAVSVAKTALWIAESQMLKETENILLMHIDFLPLKTNAFIHEGNSLRTDWNDIIPNNKLSYIMGNPPFVGYDYMNPEQQKDMAQFFDKTGRLDYVTAWYVKAANYIDGTGIHCSFVSTNSIVQGVQVPTLWKPLYEKYKIHIDFAHKTFIWNSEASLKASVHCVIIGFSQKESERQRVIYEGEKRTSVNNINFYLNDAPNIIVEQASSPICNVPKIVIGSMPKDGGGFIIEKDEYEEIKRKDANSFKYIHRYMMGKEFINNIERYCFWFVGADPADLKNCPSAMKHINMVREYRLSSDAPSTVKIAETPALFAQIAQPSTRYIALPKVSSQRRRYIPIGYLEPDIIAGDKLFIIPDSSLYQFGVLTSNVHMSWMRATAGRLKSDYSYTSTTVYNTFPWPSPSKEQVNTINSTAQGILDARALYPNSSLADLYDPLTMPKELQRAHSENDKAVMQAYGFSIKNTSEADCVAALMRMYQEMTSGVNSEDRK